MSKVRGQYSFFDVENQLDKIYQINDTRQNDGGE